MFATMKPKYAIGILACLLLAISTFMPWAWYPDLEKHFTGFFSEKNYYGKPGILFCAVAVAGLATYIFPRRWLLRLNLFFAAIGMAYAIKSYLLYTGAYTGIIPEKEAGVYIMAISSLVHLVVAMLGLNAPVGKKNTAMAQTT
jgi:hypothetical protein